jgi:hypothetical protein
MTTPSQIKIIGAYAEPTDDEAAAIATAIASLIGAGDEPPAAEPVSRWRDSATLIGQGIAPTRTPAQPRWATIERIRRAGRGGCGITGL